MYKVFSKLYDKFMEFSDYGAWEKQVEELIKEGQPNGKTLLDIGCGTGELLLRMTKNYQCDGMDLSEEMLKIAQRKLKHREVRLFLGDMVEFDTGYKYDIMVSLFDTVNHMVSVEELESHLESVLNSLNNGGVYIFDIVDREFGILGISLDVNTASWLSVLAKKENLWPELCIAGKEDDKRIRELYSITGIPFGVLLDKSGKIIAVVNAGWQHLKMILNEYYKADDKRSAK